MTMLLREAKILSVSNEIDPRIRALLGRMESISVETVSSGLECCTAVRASSYFAILANFPLPDCTPDELLAEIKRVESSIPVLIVDAAATLSSAVRLTKARADHVFGADFAADELASHIEAARELRQTLDLASLSSALGPSSESTPAWRKFLVGSSSAMERVFRIIELVGPRRCTVLIGGKQGPAKKWWRGPFTRRETGRGCPW